LRFVASLAAGRRAGLPDGRSCRSEGKAISNNSKTFLYPHVTLAAFQKETGPTWNVIISVLVSAIAKEAELARH
jgi:hypothetical protein